MSVGIVKKKEKNKRKWQMNQGLIILLMVTFGFVLVGIGKLFNSYALNEVVEKITFTSKKLNYKEKVPGSIQVKKSAKRVDRGKARITFEIDTILDVNDYSMDLILVLDESIQGNKLDQMKESVIGRLVRSEEDANTYTAYIQGEGGVIANENCNNLFDSFHKVESFEELEYFDIFNVKTMDGMFSKCTALINLDVSHFNTSKMINMESMFRECYVLTSLDLSNFDTANVVNMNSMFFYCINLSNLDISKFDVSKVSSMGWIFDNCKALIDLDLTHFKILNVKNLSFMFRWCSFLQRIRMFSYDENFNPEEYEGVDMSYMFDDCVSLVTLDLNTSFFLLE